MPNPSQASPVGEPALPEFPSFGLQQAVILVADDDVLIRNLVTILMQSQGYFVLSASDGHEGLELSRSYSGVIHLLITDMVMPRLNGADLSAHLLDERPGIKVLMISGADISAIVDRNSHMPFLPKPLNGEALIERVEALLAGPSDPRLTSNSNGTGG